MLIRLAEKNPIIENSLVDGSGERTVVFVQGCHFHCSGCQNKHLWDHQKGLAWNVQMLAEEMIEVGDSGNFTISGGEPLDQAKEVSELIKWLRYYGAKNICVYTGYLFDQVLSIWNEGDLQNIDTIIDGQYIADQDDNFLTYRGSRNQRVINVQKTLESGLITEENWNDEIILTGSGDIICPIGTDLNDLGTVKAHKMCGEQPKK